MNDEFQAPPAPPRGVKRYATTSDLEAIERDIGALREWIRLNTADDTDVADLRRRVEHLEEAMQRAGGDAIVDAIDVARRRGHRDVVEALKKLTMEDPGGPMYPAYRVSDLIERIEKGEDP